MALIIIGVVVFVVAIGTMVVCMRFSKSVRLVVAVVMTEVVCVSGVLIAMGLYQMGLMD